MTQSNWEEEFKKKFPHKLLEVVDDFGSSIKSDIKSFIQQEKIKSFKIGYDEGFKKGQTHGKVLRKKPK